MKLLLHHAPGVDLSAAANSKTIKNVRSNLLDNRSGDEDDETPPSPTEIDHTVEEAVGSQVEDEAESEGAVLESLEVEDENEEEEEGGGDDDENEDDADYQPKQTAKSVQVATATKRKRESISKVSGPSDKEEVWKKKFVITISPYI